MSEKPKTLEELRKHLIAELGAFQMTMFRTDTSDEEVAEFEKAVRADEREKIEDSEVYKKMVAKYVYWKGRYEMAVRGMTDEAAIEIMGKEP